MDISNVALTVYVSTEFVNIAGIIIDYILIKDGLSSITEVSIKYPIVGTCLIIFQMVSPVSLGIHLWYYNKDTPSLV